MLVTLFPPYTVFGIVAMVASGVALARVGMARLIPLYQLRMVAAFGIFAFAGSLGQATIGSMFLAMTTGANSTLPNAFWAEFYGTARIGSIRAMAAAVMVLGSAIGPGIIGVMIDLGVDLATQYVGMAVYFLVATLCKWVGIVRCGADLPRFA